MRIYCLARLSILALAIGTLPVSAKVPQSPLVGTWVLTIQPPAPVPSYIEISTFVVDGTTTGSPSVQPPPGIISTGDVYGVWKGSGDEAGTYDSTVIALTYDKSGAVNGTVKFNNHFKLISESEIEGISQFQICDLNAVCPEPTPNSATFTGARLQIQPVTQ